MLKQLVHYGIIIPESPEYLGLKVQIRGERVELTPKQEEMAMAFARKKDTPYVQDPVFVANFLSDWAVELGLEGELSLMDVDLTPCNAMVDAERARKAALSKEERRALAMERKAEREALKAKYGYAIVDGQRVELGTYMAEPSGIFMGRGEHPLRGRWKEGAHRADVTLNLSPDAIGVDLGWGEVVWQPDSMWVAKWQDKLSGKTKYVWLGDTAPVKQEREAAKFDKALSLEDDLRSVRAKIRRDLADPQDRKRMIATACYLIDALCLRVGDEKDEDEADTVGATTLRPEHLVFMDDGVIKFDFLGKDSVEWKKSLKPPTIVYDNLQELARTAQPAGNSSTDKPQLFHHIGSREVNQYLSDLRPGLTAKVFRTHHASMAVSKSLALSGVTAEDPEYLKWKAATLANLEAALLCNHTKQATGDWSSIQARYKERQEKAQERVAKYRQQAKQYSEALVALREEAKEKTSAAKEQLETARARLGELRQRVNELESGPALDRAKKQVAKQRTRVATAASRLDSTRERYRKRAESAQARIDTARERRERATIAREKIKSQASLAGKKRTWNLGTSLKSYIDPRVYQRWGNQVGYSVVDKYYPTTLRRKFAWVRFEDGDADAEAVDERLNRVEVRSGMYSDALAIGGLLCVHNASVPGIDLPIDTDVIVERYMPRLESPWRECVIALDDESKVIAMVAIGPEWQVDGDLRLDVTALAHPEWQSKGLARMLAEAVLRAYQSYQVQHPKSKAELVPSDMRVLEWFPALVQVLDLTPGQEAEDDDPDWDEE